MLSTLLTVSAGLQDLQHSLQAQHVHHSDAQHHQQPVHTRLIQLGNLLQLRRAVLVLHAHQLLLLQDRIVLGALGL